MILWNILQQTSLWDMYSRYLYTWKSGDNPKGVQRPHAVSTQWGHMDVCIIALDPCLIYDTDRYGWIWGSLCACAPARRHCRRLQPIAIGYSRPSSWPERSHAGMATKISDYGCSGLDRANTWTNSVLICDLRIFHEMRYSLYVRRNARFFHPYENLKLQDRLISLTH